ncbi:hypothetical protein ACJJTC_007351 [Scirpophaga incertulas]
MIPPNRTASLQPKPSSHRAAAPAAKVLVAADIYEAGHEHAHPELCPALGARLQLLVAVTSAPSHRAARDAIRLTWGHFRQRSDVSVAFVLGAPPAALRPALLAEDTLFGDLVIGRSVDTYSNMTLKTLSILEWADTYCPRARRLLKTDDDMFINIPRLLEFSQTASRVNATKTIWGKVVRKSLPKRTPRSKYFVPPSQFPDKVFPDFATGPAYLVTADAIKPLFDTALKSRYLRLEDVFVTGVVASRLGIRRIHAAEFHNRKLSPAPCALRKSISLHMVRYHEQFDLWRKLLDGTVKCT